ARQNVSGSKNGRRPSSGSKNVRGAPSRSPADAVQHRARLTQEMEDAYLATVAGHPVPASAAASALERTASLSQFRHNSSARNLLSPAGSVPRTTLGRAGQQSVHEAVASPLGHSPRSQHSRHNRSVPSAGTHLDGRGEGAATDATGGSRGRG